MARNCSLSVVEHREGEWCVWITLPDHDPIEDLFGFVIGSGDTREAAIADAVDSLQDSVRDMVHQPPTVAVVSDGVRRFIETA